jgi:uncharacterized protein YaiI (UPF0178 family)
VPLSEKDPTVIWIDGLPLWEGTLSVLEERPEKVVLLSQQKVHVSSNPKLRCVVLGEEREAAYLWVDQRLRSIDVMVTRDPKMAKVALQAGAKVLAPEGRRIEEAQNESAIQADSFLRELESIGAVTGGHLPLNERDRARYTLVLEEVLGEQESLVVPESPVDSDLPF